MRIIIIEDERVTARDLAQTISDLFPDIEIEKMLSSVEESVTYLSDGHDADLIFSDIQLGDGLSFEIFTRLKLSIPVIFCTAFDEYALEAFRANGIDYILKPFTSASVSTAIKKYLSLRGVHSAPTIPYQTLEQAFSARSKPEAGSILVYQRDKILPIPLTEISFFFLKHGVVTLTTFEKISYTVNRSMEELSKMTEPQFFRANRQFLVNRRAVVDASSYLSRKLTLSLSTPVPETITVSREKMTQFLAWLTLPS